MNSHYPELPSHQEEAGPSNSHLEAADFPNSGGNVDVPAIFLSHSGRQKFFVESLYNTLVRANHSPFFDKHTIRKASSFSDHIERAARGCRLGVVVLSDDFLSSKWPMLELEMLVLQRGRDAMVFPLFYKLHPKDLKNSKNLLTWQACWEKIAPKHVEQWKKAVEKLDSFAGEVFHEGTSETVYIEKVVRHICTLVPCHVPYDTSTIQGHQRLTKKIAGVFENVEERSYIEEKACIVGLHGVGGLGKTTLCRCMVNFYASQYLGRSCHIELPHDGVESKIVQECKRALKKLTNLNDKQLFKEVVSFDQIIHLMRQHMKANDVFFAIDNVGDCCREKAKSLLGVGFTAKSKILLTSRSEQVLKDLLVGHTMTSHKICPLPALEREEAFQILQNAFEVGDLRSSVDRYQMDILLERCRFDGIYHSSSLKALGQHVRRVLGGNKQPLAVVLKGISIRTAKLQTVEELIRINYDSLPQHKRDMFLDIAVLAITRRYDYIKLGMAETYAGAQQWLCLLYKEFHKSEITGLIHELASDGLIQIVVDDHGGTTIGMHDLYMELARGEVNNSDRFFMERSIRSVEEMELERLGRVFLSGNRHARVFEALQLQRCGNLQVLHVDGVEIRRGIDLRSMPSLRVLVLRRIRKGSAASMAAVKLNGLVQLQKMGVEKCEFITSIRGLDALQNLQKLYIEGCPHLKNLDGLSGLIRLEAFDIHSCESLKNLDGLSALIRLETLDVGSCKSLNKVPDLRSLTRLQKLWLSDNKAMEEVGCLGSALKDVKVESCPGLKKMGVVSGATCLTTLELRANRALKEVGGEYLSSSLEHLTIEGCGRLRRFPQLKDCSDLGKTANLQHLKLEGVNWRSHNFSNEQWRHFTRLKSIFMRDLGSIKKLEVGSLSSLESLVVMDCEALEEIGDLSALHCLRNLNVSFCPRLKKVGGLVGILTHLQTLLLQYCESLEASTMPDVSLLSQLMSASVCLCGDVENCCVINVSQSAESREISRSILCSDSEDEDWDFHVPR